MRVGTVTSGQIQRSLCPNGHRSCLVAGCWLTEDEVSYAIILEAGYQFTVAYRDAMGEPPVSRKQFLLGQWSKGIRRRDRGPFPAPLSAEVAI